MTSSHADSNMYISFFLARLHLQLEKDQKKNQKDNFTEKREREREREREKSKSMKATIAPTSQRVWLPSQWDHKTGQSIPSHRF